jgi:tetratricopeptide (TPR) repeat protein
LSIFEKLAADHPLDFSVQDELARAHETLGDGLGRTANSSEERLNHYKKSLPIRQNLLGQRTGDQKLRRSVALTHLKIGGSSDPKQPEAVEEIKQAIEILERLAAEDPTNARACREVGFAYYQFGNTLLEKGDFEAARESRRKAFAIREKIAAEDPKNVQARFDFAVAHGDLAEGLSLTGDTESALDHAAQSLSILQALAKADPTNAVYRRNVGLCYEKLGEIRARMANDDERPIVQRISDWNEAHNWYQRGGEIFSTLRDEGILMPVDSDRPQKFAAKVKQCEDGLSRLKTK